MTTGLVIFVVLVTAALAVLLVMTTALRTLSSAFGNGHEGPGARPGADMPPKAA
jgi:hypothetical protein